MKSKLASARRSQRLAESPLDLGTVGTAGGTAGDDTLDRRDGGGALRGDGACDEILQVSGSNASV